MPENQGLIVQFQNVGLRYRGGPEILHDINFALGGGSFHFLTGSSGAGKSSLLKLMHLALRPTRGLIRMFGQDVAATSRREMPYLRRRIGLVFQNFRLLDHLSAFDNVALPLRIARVAESELRADVSEILDWVGLADHIHVPPPALSGGQQQRVAIARAVIARPRLLLADEPTGNVDHEIGLRLMHLFEELHRTGTTVVIATHNQALVSRFDHPRLRLEGGALAAGGA